MTEAERTDLALFVQQVQQILEWVAYDQDSAVPDYLRQPLTAAWEKAKGRFDVLADAIKSEKLDAELELHGLSGPELQLKLIAFRAYYEAWARLLDKRQTPGAGPLSWVRAFFQFLRRRSVPVPRGTTLQR
jgi:hypothetical protein